MISRYDLVIPLENIEKEDEGIVGRDIAGLGEIAHLGIPIPKGFVITQNAYKVFEEINNIKSRINQHLLVLKAKNLFVSGDNDNKITNEAAINDIRRIVLNGQIPDDFKKIIYRHYKSLENPLIDASVTISSNFEKNKHENIQGEANLIHKIKTFWYDFISFDNFSEKDFYPILYFYKLPKLYKKGFMYTVDRKYENKSVVEIQVSDQSYKVSKNDFSILDMELGKIKKQHIPNKQLEYIARVGIKLQEHYYFPQEITFVFNKSTVYFIRSKPVSSFVYDDFSEQLSESPKTISDFPYFNDTKKIDNKKILLKGEGIFPGITSGHIKVLHNHRDINKLKKTDIAVVSLRNNSVITDILKIAKGVVVSDRQKYPGLKHLSKRFGKPIIISDSKSIKSLKKNILLTMNGETGNVYLWQN